MGCRGTRTTRHKLPEWTEESIQKVLNRQYLPSAKYITNNLFIFGAWESDYAAMTQSHYWHEVEIKISLADFKNDFTHKADKHHILVYGYDLKGKAKVRPHFFSYAVPDPLVDKVKDLIPPYAGLVGISANGFATIIKSPVLIHKHKYTDDELRLTEKFYFNYISYRDKYSSFSKELKKYRAELNSMRAEFKAVTGKSWKEHLSDVL